MSDEHFVPEFKGDAPIGEMIYNEEQLPLGTEREEAILRGALAIFTRYEDHICKACALPDPRDIKRATLMALRYVESELAARDKEIERLKEAAYKLIDYCEDHNWGTMPEPFDSINPLLKLLGRDSTPTKEQ